MTSDEKKPGGNDGLEGIGIDEIVDAVEDVMEPLDELDVADAEIGDAGDDEMDMDAEEDFSFDIAAEERGNVRRGGGGFKKVLAPVLVLVAAAGVGGYIIMNPSIISDLMGAKPPAKMAPQSVASAPSAPSAFSGKNHAPSVAPDNGAELAATSELPQPAGVIAELPAPAAADTAADMPRGPEDTPATAEAGLAAALNRGAPSTPDAMEEASSVTPPALSDESAPPAAEAALAPPVDMPAATGEKPGLNPPDETDMAMAQDLNNEAPAADADKGAMMEQGSADAPAPVVETVPPENAVAPAMPRHTAAPAKPAPSEQAAPSAASSAQGAISAATPPQATTSGSSGAYYDSGVTLPPSGPMAKEAIREVDPTVEPASKYIVARKDKSASSQEALLESANRALELQRYDAAMEMFEQLFAKNKRDPRILMGLAVSQQYAGRPESAIQTYEALLDIDPKNADAMVNMLGLLRNTYPEVALRRLLDLQDKYPNNAGIAAQIGVTQADLGHYDDAIRYLQMAASLEPQNAQHLFNIAVIADRKGATNDAIKYYEQALETDAVYGNSRTLNRQAIYDRLSTLRKR